jgi:hypothetical protein
MGIEMPRGGSAKGAPRGNAKKRVVELDDSEHSQEHRVTIKAQESSENYHPNLRDLGKSPLKD